MYTEVANNDFYFQYPKWSVKGIMFDYFTWNETWFSLVIIGSDSSTAPVWCHVFTWTYVTYYKSDFIGTHLNDISINPKPFSSVKSIWTCCLQNVGHFVSAPSVKYICGCGSQRSWCTEATNTRSHTVTNIYYKIRWFAYLGLPLNDPTSYCIIYLIIWYLCVCIISNAFQHRWDQT